MQSSIEQLGSQHRIHQWPLHWETYLTEKLQIEFGIVENLDAR